MRRLSSLRKNRVRGPIQEISLTPLIDTALTLLIIFMVATPMLHNTIKITLPRGNAQEAGNVKQELIVEVNKHGHLYFNSAQMTAETLIAELKKKIADSQDITVFVKADKESPYGPVMEIVDQLKVVGGVKYVALATQKYA